MITNSLAAVTANKVQANVNNLNRAVEMGVNAKKTMSNQTLALAAGTGATIAAANAVKNSSALQETITKGLKKVVGAVESSNVYKKLEENIAPYTRKAASWVKALPTPAKVVVGAGAILTGFVSNIIAHKGSENQGKILQKYEDKQTIQKALNNI